MLTPLLVVFVPIAYVGIQLAIGSSVPRESAFLTAAFAWVPFVNSTITIYFVKPYRKFMGQLLCSSVKMSWPQISIGSSVTQRAQRSSNKVSNNSALQYYAKNINSKRSAGVTSPWASRTTSYAFFCCKMMEYDVIVLWEKIFLKIYRGNFMLGIECYKKI